MNSELIDFSVAYYSGDKTFGSVVVVQRQAGKSRITTLPMAEQSGKEKGLKPVFVGLTEENRVITFDPESKAISVAEAFTADAFPAHVYSDPEASRDWYMNDGDKATGNDLLNCGDQGSSVTVVENSASEQAAYLKTICVGRGHHQANFSYPSEAAPQVPRQAYISNLKDGTLSVVGNDPEQRESYLQVVATINLCEAKRESFDGDQVPNNAFPHGLVYSKISGKVYNLNNGYGTVAVIDPVTHEIESRLEFKGFSNLFISPCGRYLFGRGADRKSDAGHVIARLAVMDVTTHEVVSRIELPDIYISKYFFNPQGNRLYLTTSSSGTPEQQANLKEGVLLVFDLNALPELQQVAEVRLSSAIGTLDFLDDANGSLIFSSNSAEGMITLLCGESNEVLETIRVAEPQPHSRLWLLSN